MAKVLKPDEAAARLFRQHGGTLRTTEALRLGIHPRTLYRLRESGVIVQLSRGLNRLAALPASSDPDLLVVAKRIPGGVLCLISALAFQDLTTEIPHEVHVALPRGAETPRIEHPPVKAYRFSATTHKAGIETHEIDGVPLRVYSAEKTIADCFKFRSEVGMETALAALKAYRRSRGFDVDKLMRFARLCRVEKVLKPYVEALL